MLLDNKAVALVRCLEDTGVKFSKWAPYGKYNKNKLKKKGSYILIIPPYAIFSQPYCSLLSPQVKVASLSGRMRLRANAAGIRSHGAAMRQWMSCVNIGVDVAAGGAYHGYHGTAENCTCAHVESARGERGEALL